MTFVTNAKRHEDIIVQPFGNTYRRRRGKGQNVVYDANAEVRKVGSFNGVSVGSGIALYLSQGNEQAVAVSAEDPKYVERIITEVKDGTLRIRVDGKMWNNWNWGNKNSKPT